MLDEYQRRKKDRERKQAVFLPVTLTASAAGSPLSLILPEGLRLEVPADFDEEALVRLVSVLS